MTDNITLPRKVVKEALEALEYMTMTAERCVDNQIPDSAIAALRKALAAPSEDIEALRRDAESYQKQKDRNYRLQKLLKECRKVMEANGVFRDTKVHKDLKTRIRIELENKT